MATTRRSAIVIGALYLTTHVTSVAGLALYGPVLTSTAYADYLAGPGASARALVGGFLEVVLSLAIVGTGVAFYPVIRRFNEGKALGYAGLRTLEAAVIAVGITPLMAAVTLVQSGGVGDAALIQALASFHNWTFLIGPSFVCGVNTVVLATVLFRSRLVPRFIPALGLVGGPLVFVSGLAQMFGALPQASTAAALAAIPVFAWEVSLALYLVFRGFREFRDAPQRSTSARTIAAQA
ncbi:DUF4386 domain-containing protein [Sinomonas sp. JGH33]|uniref:DUF4386 domain-containing protein n=1 Tax=Sinomonas terricola TaxID=3110330 RepID=A0ABU5T521_9MICC|nr:DUF4386 domain-containing protein [Sinomonas sp. JGH33]MEA5454771.1 DUF4386 domain-containing protein [Sinomonas sp. JGH33]